LGSYEPNRTLQVRWKFRTGILSNPVEVLIGVYRNKLTSRTVLQKIVLDTFQNYENVASVETSPPA
jgi:hypothetical protein